LLGGTSLAFLYTPPPQTYTLSLHDALPISFRAELETRAGGNPSWNTGVSYFRDLAKSADLPEVVALYRAAGLSLGHDLQALDQADRKSTRLNSSHQIISYAVFCLKKKNKNK